MTTDHVELFVPDREAAARWYGEWLGFAPMPEHAGWAAAGPVMLTCDGGATMLALFPGEPQGALLAEAGAPGGGARVRRVPPPVSRLGPAALRSGRSRDGVVGVFFGSLGQSAGSDDVRSCGGRTAVRPEAVPPPPAPAR